MRHDHDEPIDTISETVDVTYEDIGPREYYIIILINEAEGSFSTVKNLHDLFVDLKQTYVSLVLLQNIGFVLRDWYETSSMALERYQMTCC